EFDLLTDVERSYCRREVILLAELMEKFREVAIDTDMVPVNWRGPGAIAAALYHRHKEPKRMELEVKRPKRLQAMAAAAYYGGRFEVTQIGKVAGPVYEYDINSAYPAAMLKLPCPLHTTWRPFKAMPPCDDYF